MRDEGVGYLSVVKRLAVAGGFALLLLACGCGSSLGSRCVGVEAQSPKRISYYQYNRDLSVTPPLVLRWSSAAAVDGAASYDVAVWRVQPGLTRMDENGNVVDEKAVLYLPGVFTDPDACRAATWWGERVAYVEGIQGLSWEVPVGLKSGVYGWSVRIRKGGKVSGWCYASERGVSGEGRIVTLEAPFLLSLVDSNEKREEVDGFEKLRRGFQWP